jgi:carbamoyltransferase
MMYLGVSCTGHHNSIALVDEAGTVLYAQAAERDYQSKLSFNMAADEPIKIKRLLEEHWPGRGRLTICRTWSNSLSERMLREIAFLDEPANQTDQILRSAAGHWKRKLTENLTSIIEPNLMMAGAGARWAAEELGIPYAIRNFDHHLCHAAYACLTSPFAEATCVVVDGYSEDASQSVFRFGDGKVEELPCQGYGGALNRLAASLGVYYGFTVCMLCGFSTYSGEEWKVMGLAPYGKLDEELLGLLQRLITVEDGLVTMPPSTAEAAIELLECRCPYSEDPDRCADLAHTAQYHFNALMKQVLDHAHGLNPSENLVLTGGCALNSSFNGRALSCTPFSDLHVPSAPGDDGNSIGAAFLGFMADQGSMASKPYMTPYLGDEIPDALVAELVAKNERLAARKLPYAELFTSVAQSLSEGKIVAWVQGRAEFGPRALGNRSILADPRDPRMKEKINDAVKFREPFRPFAPAILDEFGSEYFLDYHFTPYMEKTLFFRPEKGALVPAVCHEDGTGRLQSVRADTNLHFYNLLKAFHALTGVPVLLNTSLNVMGKPIVSSLSDVLYTFLATDIDILVVGEHIFAK